MFAIQEGCKHPLGEGRCLHGSAFSLLGSDLSPALYSGTSIPLSLLKTFHPFLLVARGGSDPSEKHQASLNKVTRLAVMRSVWAIHYSTRSHLTLGWPVPFPDMFPWERLPSGTLQMLKRLSQKRTYVLFGRYYLVVFVLQPFWQKLAQLRNSWQSSEFPGPCGAPSSESR